MSGLKWKGIYEHLWDSRRIGILQRVLLRRAGQMATLDPGVARTVFHEVGCECRRVAGRAQFVRAAGLGISPPASL